MARKIENMPEDGRRRYDWDSWLDGGVWALIPGVDFVVAPDDFRRYALRVAGERGARLITRVSHDGIVYLRAHLTPVDPRPTPGI